MLRTYELMIVMRPEFPVDDEARRQKLVESLVGSDGVSVKSIAMVGKKRLAYPIRKISEGVYVLGTLQARALKSSDIEKRASLNDEVLRFLLINKS